MLPNLRLKESEAASPPYDYHRPDSSALLLTVIGEAIAAETSLSLQSVGGIFKGDRIEASMTVGGCDTAKEQETPSRTRSTRLCKRDKYLAIETRGARDQDR